jgi:GntR family transcriptional regulator/MocR family aminotransferase
MDISAAPLYQAVLADLIREGHFARHLRRMRSIYAERRRALDAALLHEPGPIAGVVGDHAGMHLVIKLAPSARDHEIAVRAAQRGISVIPLSSCYTGRRTEPGLVLGYGSTHLAEIPDAVRRLKAIIRG